MTKNIERTKLGRELSRAQNFRDAAIMLMSSMDALWAQIIHTMSEEDFVLPDGKRASTQFREEIRAALNDFERRTHTAVLEFEWPSTVYELQLKRKEAEKDASNDDMDQAKGGGETLESEKFRS